MSKIEERIREKAYQLGYEKCGNIPVHKLAGYGEKLEERMERVPGSERFYQSQKRLVNFLEIYPWAKSAVVVAMPFSKYKVPEGLEGHIGKSYLFDMRLNEASKDYQSSKAFGLFMEELGLKTATYEKFGLLGMRWAALKAGLGLVRKNNFFYTESGSWVHIEAWLIDREIEYIETSALKPCPENCNRCISACPTASLSEAYTMNPMKCISFLTTFGGRDMQSEALAKNLHSCIYGCDICQEVCQMNHGKWKGTEDFPGLEELAPYLSAEGILEMTEDFYRMRVQPKFFYLSPEELWKWKVNALNFMDNQYKESYKSYLIEAAKSDMIRVKELAESICERRFLRNEERREK